MQAMSIRIFLILFLLILINPYSLPAATEQRIALVIGNSAYSSGPLKNPVNDATDMAVALKRAGFTVMLKKNANLQEMVEAIEAFGNNLKRGGVGLFYYAGHGVQVSSINYLLPISAKINKETDVRFQAVDAGRVLAEMENANNGLNIVILDACRDNPFGKSFRSASRGLAIVANAPSGTFISYSTGAGQVAGDGEGKNSPYTRALLENIAKPGLTINKIFMNVRSKVKKETGQVPWELSSLEGDFFFVPGAPEKSAAMVPGGKTAAARDELDDENKKLEVEQRSLEEEKAAFAKKKALDEKRRQIEEERALLVAEQEAVERKKKASEEKQRKVTDERERLSSAFTVGSKTYQVTGPVLEISADKIVVQKGNDHWELRRGTATKVTGDLKVDSKVTVAYMMKAVTIGEVVRPVFAVAAGSITYQVTGPVLEISADKIVVQKGNDKWEVFRDAETKVAGDLSVGSKVTIQYKMIATKIEVKEHKKADAKKINSSSTGQFRYAVLSELEFQH